MGLLGLGKWRGQRDQKPTAPNQQPSFSASLLNDLTSTKALDMGIWMWALSASEQPASKQGVATDLQGEGLLTPTATTALQQPPQSGHAIQSWDALQAFCMADQRRESKAVVEQLASLRKPSQQLGDLWSVSERQGLAKQQQQAQRAQQPQGSHAQRAQQAQVSHGVGQEEPPTLTESEALLLFASLS